MAAMLWYLLYPFRGIRDPPLPSSESLVRRAFYRHGALTARYWLAIMLSAVATGVILSYPTVFMSDFPPGGINGLPHHVWTGSASFESRTEKQPDLEMRQIWLRGGYMQALNRSVLSEAFKLQHELLRDHLTIGSSASTHPNDWAIHSPTLFWSHSVDTFISDTDPLQTINDFKNDAAFSHLNLRPMSVFAGKSFRNTRLIAADALVLTLLSHHNATVGSVWDSSLKTLSTDEDGLPWTVQNSGNASSHDNIYEYKFQPFSINQYWALLGAYLCMVLYTAASLRRLKAFKSRFGVVMTAVTQGWRTCEYHAAYVLIGPDATSSFRLINGILAYPPEMATTQRIANGIGDTGMASVASAAQNLAILWILSQFVSPGVAAFCAFAAIALMFDFFFLITFFVAVLSVDIRRMELQDSLTRPRAVSRRRRPPERQSWVDALIQGKVPFTTRMAGSAITVAFVMLLNWHFSDNNISVLGISPWSSPSTKQYLPTLGTDSPPAHSLNRTLNPVSWIRAQNTSTAAAQFMHVIKPGVQSFTARVFDPVVIVVGGADRTGIPPPADTWLTAMRELAIRHFYPFTLAVVFVVASVTVLMNFLLWDARAEAEEADIALEDGPLSCRTVETTHRLDIVQVANTTCGKILSIGLDRSISLVQKDRSARKYAKTMVGMAFPAKKDERAGLETHWPIAACVLDGPTGQMAALCRSGALLLGKALDSTYSRLLDAGPLVSSHAVIFFEYITKPHKSEHESVLIILFRDGTLYEFSVGSEKPEVTILGEDEDGIAAAAMYTEEGHSPRLFALTSLGSVLQYCWQPPSNSWTLLELGVGEERPSVAAPSARDSWIYPIPLLGLCLVCTPDEVQVLEAHSLRVCGKVEISKAKQHSIRVLHSDSQQCPDCRGVAVEVFCIAYTNALDSSLVLLSYGQEYGYGPGDPTPTCLSARSSRCTALHRTAVFETRIPDPGQWDATSKLCLAGVRRYSPPSSTKIIPSTTSTSTSTSAISESPLRRRRRQSAATSSSSPADQVEEWEAYMLTHKGTLLSSSVRDISAGDPDAQLFSHSLGPVARVGANTVAVAIGNSVVVVEARTNPDATAVGENGHADAGGGGLVAAVNGVRRAGSRRGKSPFQAGLRMSRRGAE
ncbi:hypothetical protein ANO11243_041710 [Dothideomycetidae sp. 11243]|nr:hypothetical protein ANO11243_041710 [fungal sp. No.11243]